MGLTGKTFRQIQKAQKKGGMFGNFNV